MASHVQAEDAEKAKSAPTKAAAGPQLEQDEGDDLDPSQYHERRLRCASIYMVQHILPSAIMTLQCLHLNIRISSIITNSAKLSCVQSEAVLQALECSMIYRELLDVLDSHWLASRMAVLLPEAMLPGWS